MALKIHPQLFCFVEKIETIGVNNFEILNNPHGHLYYFSVEFAKYIRVASEETRNILSDIMEFMTRLMLYAESEKGDEQTITSVSPESSTAEENHVEKQLAH